METSHGASLSPDLPLVLLKGGFVSSDQGRALGSAGMLQDFPSAFWLHPYTLIPEESNRVPSACEFRSIPAQLLPQPSLLQDSPAHSWASQLSGALAFPLTQLSLFWTLIPEPGVNSSAHVSLPGLSFTCPSSLVLPLECFGCLP